MSFDDGRCFDLPDNLCTVCVCAQPQKNRYTKAADMLFKMGMIAPMSVIPTLLLMQKLHLSGTYLSAILLYTAINLPWAVFIYSNFMRALPRTLEEAAIIDGCGPFRLFMNIVFHC